MVVSRDENTGIYRYEIGTTNPTVCRKNIEESGFVKYKDGVADTISYGVEFSGCKLHVTTTPTRTVIFGQNRFAMSKFFEVIKGDPKNGTYWEYDNETALDYMSGAKKA